jgi:mannose/cellobiose epimerase-like protein (N-acyl-D-glucosamine 2-epimerase family)
MTKNAGNRMLATFNTAEALNTQIASIIGFYYPQCIDHDQGGFYQYFDADGAVIKTNQQSHLVSISRLIINFAYAASHFGSAELLGAARHGIAFLRNRHRNPNTGGYAWILHDQAIHDDDNYCYGIAFVLMAYARAYQAGATEVYAHIAESFELLERHFWRAEDQLYLDKCDVELARPSSYRGQNANMHCCESMIAAYEATGEVRYRDRALILARRVTIDLAAQGDGRIWEHYDSAWVADYKYNIDKPNDKLHPWGYQPGHFTEWSKLLLLIHKYQPQPWLVERAQALFDLAMSVGYDPEFGGLYYSVSPLGVVCADGKYSWVQAETIVAAAMLASELGNNLYWCIHDQLWSYVSAVMIDHRLKCWHRNLTRDNALPVDNAIAMGRTDYHAICACIEMTKLYVDGVPTILSIDAVG